MLTSSSFHRYLSCRTELRLQEEGLRGANIRMDDRVVVQLGRRRGVCEKRLRFWRVGRDDDEILDQIGQTRTHALVSDTLAYFDEKSATESSRRLVEQPRFFKGTRTLRSFRPSRLSLAAPSPHSGCIEATCGCQLRLRYRF